MIEFNGDKLDELYNKIKYICYDIELGGSVVNPYINNPQDYDLVITTDSGDHRIQIQKIIRQYSKQEDSLRANYGFCIKVVIPTQIPKLWHGSPCMIMYQAKGHRVLIGNAVNPYPFYPTEKLGLSHLPEGYAYIQPIFGDYYHYGLSKESDIPVMHTRMGKVFYHFYMNACIIQNGKIGLTDIQKEKLNILHDNSNDFLIVLNELKLFFKEKEYGQCNKND